MPHLVLLGDSIFDNASYVPDGLPVIELLSQQLPAAWQASLLAVDGDITPQVHAQLAQLPSDASHLVLSCGGNDALSAMGITKEPAGTVLQALSLLQDLREQFRANYRSVLTAPQQTGARLVVCTIYDCVPNLDRELKAALALFNEVILFEAARLQVPVIDLRVLCDSPADYSEVSPIEPSEQGGAKIAAAIAGLMTR